MGSRTILLVEVGLESESAIRALSPDCQVVAIRGEVPFASDTEEYALCIFQAPAEPVALRERLNSLRKALPETPLVALDATGDPELVVELVRRGALDVVSSRKPPRWIAERCLARLPHAAAADDTGIIGQSAAIRRVRRAIAAVAPTLSTVLLTGETGTGKGLVARAIHRASSRREQPFVHVDCAALSPTVIESELFGHERGSFTGAVGRRMGRFELADRGTIFLDEIGDLGPELQSKLLRVLQDREYERIGGCETLRMNARVIAATSRDLAAEMHRGHFRSDLYFRLNVFAIPIPPLRERLDDVALLLERGLAPTAGRLGVAPPVPGTALVERLERHTWPGNVRELHNLIERLCVEYPCEELEPRHLAGLLESRADEGAVDEEREDLDAMEAVAGGWRDTAKPSVDSLVQLLRATGGNVSRASRRIGVSRSTLRYWIRRNQLNHLIPSD